MPATIPLSVRRKAVAAYERGDGNYQEIAEQFGVSATSLKRWYARWKQTGDISPRPRPGRRPMLSDDDRELIRDLIQQQPHITKPQLQLLLTQRIQKTPSLATIQRTLRDLGLRKRQRKPAAPAPETAANDAPRYGDEHRLNPPPTAHRLAYPSDLTNPQWAILHPILTEGRPPRPPNAHDLREICNAIFYVLRAGCPWRYLPHDFPPHSTVYDAFQAWNRDGTWERVNDALRERVRRQAGRHVQPSAALLDSQSVKTTEKGGLADTMEARKSQEESDIC